MLNVTDQARTVLHEMLQRTLAELPEDDEGLGFRLVARETERAGTQLGLALDTPQQGDEVHEHEGQSVLIIEPTLSDSLGELTLDVEQTTGGTRFNLRS